MAEFLTKTNQNRINKIISLLDLIQEEINTKDPSAEDIWSLLEPVIADLSSKLGQEPKVPPTPSEAEPELSPGRRAALLLADQASLKELVAALIGRLELYQKGK